MRRNINIASLILCISALISFSAKAQDDYKFEIGGMVGTSSYMGDANQSKLFKKPGIAAGAVFRYNINLDWSIKNNFVFGRISGDTRSSGNAFPHGQHIDFSRNLYELGSQIEFNFFSYSDKFQYLGTRRLSPYIFTGLGLTYADGKKSVFNVNIPFGLGLKYKIRDRLNLGFEFSFRKLFGDSLDVTSKDPNDLNLNDPYKIKSSIWKNKDWYALTMFSVTWDFGPRVCPCLNID